MTGKISIIIPVYNCEKYLDKCLDSIINQKYKNYEIILINDGSIDKSELICLKYKNNFANIKYFYQNNAGVSNARNKGIEESSGDFICFIDSDDIVSSNFLSNFIEYIGNNDMAMCYIKRFRNVNEIHDEENSNHIEIFKNDKKFDFIFDKFNGYTCNKMYRKSIINEFKIRFNEKIFMSEDLLFNVEYMVHASTYTGIYNYNYFYRWFDSSASKDRNNLKWFTIIDSFEKIINLSDIKKINKYPKLIYQYNRYICEAIERYSNIDKNKYKIEINNLKKKYKDSKLERKKVDFKDKIRLTCYRYFPYVFFKYSRKKEGR